MNNKNGNHVTFRTKEHNKIEVLYDAALSDNAKFQTWQLVRVVSKDLISSEYFLCKRVLFEFSGIM